MSRQKVRLDQLVVPAGAAAGDEFVLKVVDGEFTLSAHTNTPPEPSPPQSYSTSLSVDAGKVASELAGFVVRVPLDLMHVGWWQSVAADGANIRVRQSGTDLPFDVIEIDTARRTGELRFKATLATTANNFTIETIAGATAPAATDPLGRNAVWSTSYHLAVLPGAELVNRAGGPSPAAVGTLPLVGPIKRSPAIPAHQGVAIDADGNFYALDTDAIRKYDPDWSLLLTKTGVAAATGLAGVNHQGDGCVKDGELYTVVTNSPTGIYVAVWNLTTLAFVRSYTLTVGDPAGICWNPDDGHFYGTDFVDGTDTTINKYDASFNHVAAITLASAITDKQGIEYHQGSFWVTSGNAEKLYKVAVDGSTVVQAALMDYGGDPATTTELEGLCSDGTNLYVVYEMGGGTGTEYVYTMTPSSARDGLHMDTAGFLKVTGISKFTAWTMGASLINARVPTQNRAVLAYGTNDATTANFANLLQSWSGSQNRYGLWNSTDSWLLDPTGAPTDMEKLRLHYTHNGTTDRKIWRNGALKATDATVGQRPGGTGDTAYLGADNANATQSFYGSLNNWVIRNGVASADWLAAEYASWETPETFLTIAADPAA